MLSRKFVATLLLIGIASCGAEPDRRSPPGGSLPSTNSAVGANLATASAASLMEICDRQMIVMGRTGSSGEIAAIGNTIDPYCAAYLEGTFEAMLRASEVCPEPGNLPDEQLLLSVVRTYAETYPAQTRARQEFVAAAFANAYSCG